MRSTHRQFDTPSGPALIDVDRPSGSPTGLLVLGHGAGGGTDATDLLAARDAAIALGVVVARVTQPYRVAGRRAPAPAPRLDEAFLAAVRTATALRGLRSLPLITGGRSSGARVACRTADSAGADAVVALAFPVHPPGNPHRTRLAELNAVTVPVLVIQGDRDPFGMPPRRRGRRVVTVHGDHSLKDPSAIHRAVTRFLAERLEPRP